MVSLFGFAGWGKAPEKIPPSRAGESLANQPLTCRPTLSSNCATPDVEKARLLLPPASWSAPAFWWRGAPATDRANPQASPIGLSGPVENDSRRIFCALNIANSAACCYKSSILLTMTCTVLSSLSALLEDASRALDNRCSLCRASNPAVGVV